VRYLIERADIDVVRVQVLRVKDRDEFPMLIVGNKADLVQKRQVSTILLFIFCITEKDKFF
jgi:GTPase SAR1 family protein